MSLLYDVVHVTRPLARRPMASSGDRFHFRTPTDW